MVQLKNVVSYLSAELKLAPKESPKVIETMLKNNKSSLPPKISVPM